MARENSATTKPSGLLDALKTLGAAKLGISLPGEGPIPGKTV